MLLNGSPGASQAMQTAAKPFDTLGSYLDQYNTTGNNAITANTAEANSAAQSAQAGLAGAQTNLQGSVTGALGKAQGTYNDINSNLAGIQGTVNNNGTLTAAQLSNLGMDPAAYAHFMGNMNANTSAYGSAPLNEGNYFTPGTTPGGVPTAANSASAQDYAQSAALGTLAGQGNYPTNPLNAADAGQAGKANTGMTSSKFDLAGANTKAGDTLRTNDVGALRNYNGSKVPTYDELVAGQWGGLQGVKDIINNYTNYNPPTTPADKKSFEAAKRIIANDY